MKIRQLAAAAAIAWAGLAGGAQAHAQGFAVQHMAFGQPFAAQMATQLQQNPQIWQQRPQADSRQMQRADRTTQAVRGEVPYLDPTTGRAVMLPHRLPPGQSVQVNGATYAQDRYGPYYRYANKGWVRVSAAR